MSRVQHFRTIPTSRTDRMAIVLALCAVAALLSACAADTAPPVARGGIFDARAEDFTHRRVLSLRGGWRFVPGEFASTVAAAAGDVYVSLPGS
jgi:hypothetical protein